MNLHCYCRSAGGCNLDDCKTNLTACNNLYVIAHDDNYDSVLCLIPHYNSFKLTYEFNIAARNPFVSSSTSLNITLNVPLLGKNFIYFFANLLNWYFYSSLQICLTVFLYILLSLVKSLYCVVLSTLPNRTVCCAVLIKMCRNPHKQRQSSLTMLIYKYLYKTISKLVDK